jgi:hypothetical protein
MAGVAGGRVSGVGASRLGRAGQRQGSAARWRGAAVEASRLDSAAARGSIRARGLTVASSVSGHGARRSRSAQGCLGHRGRSRSMALSQPSLGLGSRGWCWVLEGICGRC